MAAEYNKKDLVIDDMILKKCNERMTDRQLKDYLNVRYGYTYETSKKYIEWMYKTIKENTNTDYEEILAATVEQMSIDLQNEKEGFTRLQIQKELNKIQGLHINKIQSNVNINNINTIRIIEVQPNSNKEMLNAPSDEVIEIPFTIENETEQPIELKPDTGVEDMNLLENENGEEKE